MKTNLFARRAKGRLTALIALAVVGAVLPAHTAFAQSTASQAPPAPQVQSLDGAGHLSTLSRALEHRSYARVAALQRDLVALGVSPGPIDGIYGPRTERAVRQYQQQNDLAVDGKAGIQTFSQLFYGGAHGVSQLQSGLASQGFNPGSIDGLYGPQTQNAVTQLQQKNGLKVDGIAGPQTLGQLRSVAANSQPPIPAPPAAPQAAPQAPSGGASVPVVPKKGPGNSTFVIVAVVAFAAAVLAIARMAFIRRARNRKEVERQLAALAEAEEQWLSREPKAPRSPRNQSRKTSTPWIDSTGEMGGSGGSRTSNYSWQPEGGEDQ